MGKQAFLSYCPKCGNQGIYENGNEICQYCGTKELPTKYDWDKWLFGGEYPNNLDEIIFNEYIKDNPLFDENIYERREGKEKLLQQASLDKQKEQNTPKCPTCGSTNVKHISTLNRAASIGVFGLFSSKIGKNYECLNCKMKW